MKHSVTSRNTKKIMAASLKKALQSKPLSKITVSEIIADCGVNRKTFYYHFEDIYALLKWMLEEDAIDVVKHFDLLVDYEKAINFVMDYVEENDHIINCVYDSIGRDELKRFFSTDLHDIIVSIIEAAENKTGKKLHAEYKEFLTEFYMDALAGMLLDWIRDREKKGRQAVVKYTIKTIQDSLTGILADKESLL